MRFWQVALKPGDGIAAKLDGYAAMLPTPQLIANIAIAGLPTQTMVRFHSYGNLVNLVYWRVSAWWMF